MREYTHKTSPELEAIEKTLVDIYEFDKYDMDMLHRKYEENIYRFLPSWDFLKILAHDWYHFNNLFVKEKIMEIDEVIKEWYKEMRKINPAIIDSNTKGTVFFYSDQRAVTVVSKQYYKDLRKDEGGNLIPHKIGVIYNEVKCNDFYAADYDVIPFDDITPELQAKQEFYTLRTYGRWVREGDSVSDGLVLGLGFWHHCIDPD
jgi:hypothetical protein